MPRGRPREFNEDEALNGAMLLFWEKGLSATSLDDLAKAMQMNRPSIYNAFGPKDAIYRKALLRYCQQLDEVMAETLHKMPQLREGLRAFFGRAIDVYCGSNPGMGCLMVCTAPGEALSHPQVGDDLKELIKQLDSGFTQRLRQARRDGEFPADVPLEATAALLQATLQTLALRARSGSGPQALRKIANFAVDRLTR